MSGNNLTETTCDKVSRQELSCCWHGYAIMYDLLACLIMMWLVCWVMPPGTKNCWAAKKMEVGQFWQKI